MYNKDLSSLRFAIYARKSTEEEDRQVQSIGDQVDTMRAIATQRGFSVADDAVLYESKSAKTPGRRPEFDRLVDMIQTGKIDGILCWKLNRIARNPQESGLIQQLLIENKLKVFVTAERDYFSDDNVLMFSVEAGMATQFSRDLQRDIKRGLNSKVAKGWLPHLAPMGYININDPIRGSVIAIDEERWSLYRQLWVWAMDSSITISEIARKADKELALRSVQRKRRGGNAPGVSALYGMFRNPFYYGEIEYHGKRYKGQHTPMVTKEEFDKVQARLRSGSRQRPKIEREIDYFSVYRGLIVCGECGCTVTYARKVREYKNGNTQAFEYVYCTNKRKDYDCSNTLKLKPEQITKMIKKELSRYTIHDDFYQFAVKYLNQWNDEQEEQREAIRMAQQRAVNEAENELYGLQRMLYSGRCDEAFFDVERVKIEKRLKLLREQGEKSSDIEKQVRDAARKYFGFARYAKSDFDGSDPIKQREVLSRLGERFVFADGEVRMKPIKYLHPVLTMPEKLTVALGRVGTYSEQRKKAALGDLSSFWYR